MTEEKMCPLFSIVFLRQDMATGEWKGSACFGEMCVWWVVTNDEKTCQTKWGCAVVLLAEKS